MPASTAVRAASSDLPEDVELELLARFVADAHRLRVLVAGQPVELDLGEPPFAADAVHDLELAGVAGDGSLQPTLPGARFFAVAAQQQGLQGERGVTQPGVAVVPVAHAAELFGQRRRRRRAHRAGRRVLQRLHRDERAHDVIAPLTLIGAALHPFGPVPLGRAQRGRRVERCGGSSRAEYQASEKPRR